MKIAFDAKRAFHNFRGLGNYSRTLIDGLCQYYPQHSYQLYTPEFKDSRAFEWHNGRSALQVKTPSSAVGKMLPSFWRSFLLTNEINNGQADIYHGLSHELPCFSPSMKAKKVVTIHDLLFMRFPENFPWIDRQIYRRKFKYSVQNADKVIAICNQTKQDIIEFLNVPEDKIEVIYQSCNPIFFEQYSSQLQQEIAERHNLPENYILYVGALEQNKNVLLAVEAFARMQMSKNFSFVIVGGGEAYKKRLVNRATELGVVDRLQFRSGVAGSDLPAFYSRAKAFVFPSFFEGFGIPIIEAMFSGTPVITSKGSCFAESAGPDSCFIDPQNVDELVEALNKVLGDSDFHREMTVAGSRYVSRFHLKQTSETLMNFYQSLL